MKKLTAMVLCLLFIPTLTFAWGENTHVYITEYALEHADQSSPIVKTIQENPDSFWCGLMESIE